jgi:hypothetical protein
MKHATHFIEVIKFTNGDIKSTMPNPIRLLDFAISTSIKFNMQTIAIFKILLKDESKEN